MEIYTHGNYICSSYDWSESAYDEFVEVIESMSEEARRELSANQYCKYFMNELDIKLLE